MTVGLALASALLVIAAVAVRTLVPNSIDARVLAIDERNHNSGGSDVWLLQLDNGRNYFIDDVAALTIPKGSQVHKDAWSRTITIDGHPRRIGASQESVGPATWAGLVAGVAVLTALLKPGSRPAEASAPSEPATSR
jgi:hypothetical protein